jgi:hypothetical protein
MLDALAAERPGITQPLEVVHAASTQLVEVALGEDRDFGKHRAIQSSKFTIQEEQRTKDEG